MLGSSQIHSTHTVHVRSKTSSFSSERRCPLPRSILSNVVRPTVCIRRSLTDKFHTPV